MSREVQIVAALIELSLTSREFDLASIRAIVERDQQAPLPDTWNQVARQTLRTLASLGMVQIDGDPNHRLHYEKVEVTEHFLNIDAVRAARSNQALFEPQDEGIVGAIERGRSLGGASNVRGGGGQRGNGGGGFDEGEGGGEGFREVLAHPYLFSLSETEFADLLSQI